MGAYSQLLDWHVATAALSGVLAVASAIFYVVDMLRGGDTKPNAVSYFLWTVLQEIMLVAQIREGASWSAVFVFFATLDTAIITILAVVGYGYRKYGWIDLICFIFAIGAAVALWHSPVDAIIIAIVGDFVAFCPTIVKTYREPRSEHLTAWALMTISSAFGVASAEILNAANLAFPIYQVVICGFIFCLAYFGRKKPTVLN